MKTRELAAKGLRLTGRIVREEPRLFALSFAGAGLVVGIAIGGAFVIGSVVADVIVPMVDRGETGLTSLALAATILIGLSVLKVAGIFGRRLGAVYLQQSLQARYRKRIVRKYLGLPPAWHRDHPTGQLLSRASSDIEAAWSPAGSVAYAAATVLLLLGALVSLFWLDEVLTLVGLVVFPCLFMVFGIYSRTVAPRYRRSQALRGEVSALAHESFDGALTVKVMGREEFQAERFSAKVGELRDTLISIGRARGWHDPVIDALPSVGTVAVLVVGAWRLEQGAIDLGELTTAAFLFALLDTPIRAIGWLLTALPRATAGWERIETVLNASEVDTPVPSVSLKLRSGRIVAVVGPTGSGKSTVARLVAGLATPEPGAITFGGKDIRELTHEERAFVPQDSFVFDDTVRANVTLDRPGIDDVRAWAALAAAHAGDFVRRLPQGLDTRLGERGVTLSGGQRQRLILARAFAGRPRLLILDDATSAVDPVVEAAIIAGLRARSGKPAMLVVATRRPTIALADEVIYLDAGRVVATGTHTRLMATQPGYGELLAAYDREAVRQGAAA